MPYLIYSLADNSLTIISNSAMVNILQFTPFLNVSTTRKVLFSILTFICLYYMHKLTLFARNNIFFETLFVFPQCIHHYVCSYYTIMLCKCNFAKCIYTSLYFTHIILFNSVHPYSFPHALS